MGQSLLCFGVGGGLRRRVSRRGGLVRKGGGGALPAQIRRLPLPALVTFMTSSLESTVFQERETRFKSRLCYMEIKPKK